MLATNIAETSITIPDVVCLVLHCPIWPFTALFARLKSCSYSTRQWLLHSIVPALLLLILCVVSAQVCGWQPNGTQHPHASHSHSLAVSQSVCETQVLPTSQEYVVDGGRSKQTGYDAVNRLKLLRGSWISKASAEQRK